MLGNTPLTVTNLFIDPVFVPANIKWNRPMQPIKALYLAPTLVGNEVKKPHLTPRAAKHPAGLVTIIFSPFLLARAAELYTAPLPCTHPTVTLPFPSELSVVVTLSHVEFELSMEIISLFPTTFTRRVTEPLAMSLTINGTCSDTNFALPVLSTRLLNDPGSVTRIRLLPCRITMLALFLTITPLTKLWLPLTLILLIASIILLPSKLPPSVAR